ncbi:cell wall-binding repeat-containing protein [Herbiconiux daphne]|uniref:Cell wall-binding repeat-containing protein n=1 Tax=Herbiconiux daphne TaxID=2970914 RepID=A0ABT2GXS3_9MICO|nr:cell wall-binding repeat-containing protein [Herbiconiux daphne]MCS5732752.1 cell wall-binding repeat-containing protein [Herbiconiux daphne]
MARSTRFSRTTAAMVTTGLLALGLFAGTAGPAAAEEVPSPAPPTSEVPAPATEAPAPATEAPAPSPDADDDDDVHFNLVGINVSSFRAGDIISDQKMWNPNAMSKDEVQAFLDTQSAGCTNGNCLATKVFPASTSQPANNDCKAYAGAQESAASMIARIGVACGVSQKALLALIQKESSVVAMPAPTDALYDRATGYECPDTSSCDPAYKGFFNQVYNAARQLRDYQLDPPAAFPVGQSTTIAYSPDDSCGGSSVKIRTLATAALYAYTPYQPNAAAKDSSSNGDDCSSLGNLNFWVSYTDWFGYPHIDVDRIQGADRFDVSVAIAQTAYPSGAKAVYIATGAGYADALSAGPAAIRDGAPLLLTAQASLPAAVANEITALKPGKIVIVGGPNSVSPAVEQQLKALRPTATVSRLTGADRFEVSRNVARASFPSGASGAYVATGLTYSDALSASGAGGFNAKPVVLVNGATGTVDADTAKLLVDLKVKTVTIAGGPNSVSAGIASSIDALSGVTSVQRMSGADRFEASLAINKNAYATSDRVFLATGTNFPDALAGSALAGKLGSPLIVVPSNCVPSAVRASFQQFDNTKVTLLGGPNSLGSGVEQLQAC